MQREIIIVTKDFEHIGAMEFHPESANGTTIIINSAMAVKQTYYTNYALFMANEGFHVITYDYRGIGKSKKRSLLKTKASIIDWATLDFEAVLSYAKEAHPKNNITVVGHSIGGQIIGFTEKSKQAHQLVMIASQTPYWKNYRKSTMPKLLLLWYILIPFFTRLLGFFPGKTLGLFENLPKEAALQWMRWARSRNYAFEDVPEKLKSFESLRQPALVMNFADDTYAPEGAVRDLLRYYKNLDVEHQSIHPDDLVTDHIGHFGFFQKRFKDTLWASSSEWIRKGGRIKIAI